MPSSYVLSFFEDLGKKWLYSLAKNSITSWDDFIKIFLKKFYHIHKTALIRKNIMQCKQEPNEPFWKYFEHFKDLLVQCSHHGVEKWWLCQILYDGLDYQNKTLLEIMSQGRFLKADEHKGWEIYEDLADKTLQWEPPSEESGLWTLSLQKEVSIRLRRP